MNALLYPDGILRAYADVTFDRVLLVRGFTVVNGEKGITVCMPKFLWDQKEWQDQVFPCNEELLEQLTD